MDAMTTKLRTCKTCSGPVAAAASSCPHCGQNRPAGGVPAALTGPTTIVLGIVLTFAVLVWFAVLGDSLGW